MEYRQLGDTGLCVSVIAFGAGPVPALMTAGDPQAQRRAVARAIELGVNWFDTAAGYGNGQSEQSLGAALADFAERDDVHVATKVRLRGEDFDDIAGAVERSVRESLARLRRERITLLQVHNAITARRGDQPDSITPREAIAVADAFDRLRERGVVAHFGLTGTGEPPALKEAIASGRFATLQVPYHLLNPSAAQALPAGCGDVDYGDVIGACRAHGVGVFAIRVFAGGALLGNPPSQHTYKTPYFPLALYERDARHAALVAQTLPDSLSIKAAALCFALSGAGVSSAIVGVGDVEQIEELVELAAAGPLPPALVRTLQADVERICLEDAS